MGREVGCALQLSLPCCYLQTPPRGPADPTRKKTDPGGSHATPASGSTCPTIHHTQPSQPRGFAKEKIKRTSNDQPRVFPGIGRLFGLELPPSLCTHWTTQTSSSCYWLRWLITSSAPRQTPPPPPPPGKSTEGSEEASHRALPALSP